MFELVGKEIWEGSELSKIKLIRKDGSETYHFIDNRSGRELKIIQNIRRGEIDFAYETIKSDFRKVKSLEIPFSLETRIGQMCNIADHNYCWNPARRVRMLPLHLHPI